MLKQYIDKFWAWYERHYALAVGVSTGLFALQIIHLVWLSSDVVATRLTGTPLFHLTGGWELAVVFVDYLEIPSLISISLVYINEIRKKNNGRSWFFLLLLNSQWIHLFWITDEVVEQVLTGVGHTVLPAWAAWIAIGIDYLELPVIFDTTTKFIKAVRTNKVEEFLEEFKKEN